MPRATPHGRLRVGAAVGVGEGTEERVEALVKAGVDAIVVDTAHGHSKGVIERVRWVKQNYPQIDVIGGNIATGAAALALVEAGADASRSASALAPSAPPASWRAWACRRSWPSTTWPPLCAAPACRLIADGGIRYSGDIAKAMAAGAGTVMMGGMFAGTEEAPGEIVLYQGRSYKSYRGMGSIGAMQQGSADRYFQESSTGNPNADKLVPEGIEGRVPYKGSVVSHHLPDGRRHARQHGLLRLRDSIADMHDQGRVRRDHLGRHSRKPRPRRANHQRGAQLPGRLNRVQTASGCDVTAPTAGPAKPVPRRWVRWPAFGLSS